MATQITALPTAPQRNDAPSTFVTRADAWVAALPTWTTQTNAVAVEVETFKDAAATSATNSATAQGLAETAQGLAETAQTAAEAAQGLAEDAQSGAEVAAAAAQAAAGLPALVGKSLLPLRVNAGETGVEFGDVFPTQVGQAGKFLTTNGTTKSWGTPANDCALLSTSTLSGQSYIDLTLSGYTNYLIELSNITPSSSVNLWARTSPNGSTYDSGGSDYSYVMSYSDGVTGPSGVQAAGNPYIPITQNSPTKSCGQINVFKPTDSAYTQVIWQMSGYAATTMQRTNGSGARLSAAAVYALRILPSGGTLTSGTIKVYGMK